MNARKEELYQVIDQLHRPFIFTGEDGQEVDAEGDHASFLSKAEPDE